MQRMYKATPQGELVIHIFEPNADERTAAIVFFFGGGWTGGHPQQFFPHCEYLAGRGMLAASAEYRIKSKHGTSPYECVEDGKSAVRWLRAHADKFNIDPDRIASGGGSAGGHVGACTGTVPGLDADGEDAAISSRPNAMVLFNPVVDVVAMERLAARFKSPREISPVHHVRPDLPPTIIFHGTQDTTVPFEQAERFTTAMRDAGNVCALCAYEGRGHGFFNYGRGDGADYDQTVAQMDEFLVQRGFLDPNRKL